MTNKEAIKILDNLKPGDYSNPYEKGEAIVMAISALQAQDSPKPTAESVQNVQNEDLILSKAAIDSIGKASDELYENIKKGATFPQRQWFDGMAQAQSILENLPSAQPERLTDDDFETIRIHLNAYKEKLCNQGRWKEAVKYQNIIDRFMAFASAQPEPQWIPVSERLPDDLGDYLVSIKRIGWDMEEYVENDIAYWDDLEGFHKADEVLAWMPLPEPYRAERRTDDLQ